MAIWLSVVNESKIVPDADVRVFATALHAQINNEYAAAWNLHAVVLFGYVPDDAWVLRIRDYPDAGDGDRLGLHVGGRATPSGKVFAGICRDWHVPWQLGASHEALEMLGDPELNSLVWFDGFFWTKESVDPVHGSSYVVAGVPMANFVTRAYFVPDSPGPYDHLGLLSRPFTVLPTGYANRYVQTPTGLKQSTLYGVNASLAAGAAGASRGVERARRLA